MSTFVFRLIASRPDFATTMSEEEQATMGAHAAHWQPFIESGRMVFFGPVLDGTGSWGLGIVEAGDADEVRTHAAADPAVTGGVGEIEVGEMLAGFVRPAPAGLPQT